MEERLADLESRLAALERRVAKLDGGGPRERAPEPGVTSVLGEGFVANASRRLGRFLLIFGGAYMLRAITEFQLVPTAFGVFLGASYALLWLWMAYRAAGAADRRTGAVFYGVAAVLLALPLVVEAATRFDLISGWLAAVALTAFCLAALGVAVRRDLRSLGWLATAGGIVTAFVVLNATRSAVPISLALLLLGIGSLWAVYLRQWMGPQWLGALGVDAGVAVLALLGTSEQWSVDPLTAYALGALTLLAYLASFAHRSHVRDQPLGAFESVQAVASAGIVFWAAGLAAQAGRMEVMQLGILTLVLGVGAYGLAFTPQTRMRRGRNYFFFSTLGLALVVAGSALLLSPATAAAPWSLAALALAWFSGRFGRVDLSLQCTFLLLAAAVGSGVLATGFHALAGSQESWPAPTPPQVIVALTTVACLFIPVAQQSARWGVKAGLPQLLVLALSVCGVGGLMVVYLAPVLAGVGDPDPNLGTLAALRTAVLSAAAVTLALSSRHPRWPEARWLVYPVLIAVGVKLFVEDFPHGQPLTLFVALGLVGSALILVSTLLSRDQKAQRSG